MNLLLYIGVILVLTLSTSVAGKLGIQSVGVASSFVIFCCAIYNIAYQDNIRVFLYRFKYELFIVFIAIFNIVIRLMLGEGEAVRGVFFFMIMPVLVSTLISSCSSEVRLNFFKIIIAIFIIECGLAIYERLYLTNLFPFIDDSEMSIMDMIEESLGFRSTALYGHPLNNALIVSTVMGFIAICNIISQKTKIVLLMLGYIAILAFNARGVAVIWGVIGAWYLFFNIFLSKNGTSSKFAMIVLFCIAASVMYTIVINYGFGDRLISTELLDGSAMTRVDVFSAFDLIGSNDFYFGNQDNYANVMYSLGAGGVENPYIQLIIAYGIIVCLPMFISYFLWVRKILFNFNFNERVLIIVSFIVAGSTNNGLATSLPWIYFAIAANSVYSVKQMNHKRLLDQEL